MTVNRRLQFWPPAKIRLESSNLHGCPDFVCFVGRNQSSFSDCRESNLSDYLAYNIRRTARNSLHNHQTPRLLTTSPPVSSSTPSTPPQLGMIYPLRWPNSRHRPQLLLPACHIDAPGRLHSRHRRRIRRLHVPMAAAKLLAHRYVTRHVWPPLVWLRWLPNFTLDLLAESW